MPRSVVGLDIGSSAIRAVEVHGRGQRVRRAGRVTLPPGAVEGGQVRDPAAITAACRRLWHEHKFTTKEVRLGVGSGSVLVRPVELDWMPPQDLRKAMRYLVADLLPVPVDEANIDHVHLGELEREGRRMVKVLLVATARDGVDDAVRSVQAAGLRPIGADLAPLALVRAAAREATMDLAPVGTEAVVDVGVQKVSVAVHSSGLPRFVRVIPGLGGVTLTHAVVDLSAGDVARAEEVKRGSHLVGEDPASRLIRAAAASVAAEVRDTLRFYGVSDPDHSPERIVLTGLGGSNPGFAEVVAEVVGLPVVSLGPPVGRSRRPEVDADLAVSFGLCLGVAA